MPDYHIGPILKISKDTDTMNAVALIAIYVCPILFANLLHTLGRKAPTAR